MAELTEAEEPEAEVPMAATRGAVGVEAEAEPVLLWTQATNALYPRDSQRRRQHHQVHRSGHDPLHLTVGP